jgi:hypothetical protein
MVWEHKVRLVGAQARAAWIVVTLSEAGVRVNRVRCGHRSMIVTCSIRSRSARREIV